MTFMYSTPLHDSSELDLCPHQLIKNHCNIYGSWIKDMGSLFIAHGPFLSGFSFSDNLWVSHTKFEADIRCLFNKIDTSSNSNIGAIFTNGKVFIDLYGKEKQIKQVGLADFQIGGTILQVHEDREFG